MQLTRILLEDNTKFNSKFLRVGNEVYVTEPDDLSTIHRELAKKHKILGRILDFKEQNPDQIDGGYLFVDGRLIKIGASSTSLSIPITDQARKNTIKVLKKSFPDYSVKELSDE